MADALSPDSIRTRQFDVARRGYERSQVDVFLADVAARIDELEEALGRVDPTDPELGMDDPEALARELHRVGSDVGAILEAARAAAQGMRSRAGADAEVTLTDAAERAEVLLEEATEQSQAARSAAWKDGTALLRAAQAEVQAMVEAAKEEALFVRAEAEREALRLTGDAKRDRDEAIRGARAEAESIVDQARTESDAVLAAANQQAEQAQERARALEDRRTELLAELEAARASITDMEQEIESRRQELETPAEPEEPASERTHHTDDGGSVRIVAPSAVVPVHPVDAEELVAEVEALRATPVLPEPVTPAAPPVAEVMEPSPKPEPIAPHDPVSDLDGSDPDASDRGAPDGAVPTAIESSPEPEVDVVPPAPEPSTPEATALEPEVEPEVEPAPEVEQVTAAAAAPEVDDEPDPPASPAVPETSDDPIGSLFDQLRSVADEPEPAMSTASASSNGMGTASPTPAVAQTEQDSLDDGSAAAVEVAEVAGSAEVPGDEARDLQARNEALRSIKRSLVELQNEALEHLRTDEAWMPDEAFTDRFGDAFGDLATAVTGTRDDAEGLAFGADLFDAVSSAIERARADGAGEREVAAAASRIFRMWRSDEAERRVMGFAPASV